ncbi:hypothetical protein HK096_004612, partial [Nowakowskiella sp. JEL0078]
MSLVTTPIRVGGHPIVEPFRIGGTYYAETSLVQYTNLPAGFIQCKPEISHLAVEVCAALLNWDPVSISKALNSADRELWIPPIRTELNQLIRMVTWKDIIDIPSGKQLDGLEQEQEGSFEQNFVCLKTISLKMETLTEGLLKYGFIRCKTDDCVFYHKDDKKHIIGIYVDDTIVIRDLTKTTVRLRKLKT